MQSTRTIKRKPNKKEIRAYLIDPFSEKIMEIPWDIRDSDEFLESMQRIIGSHGFDRAMIEDTHDWVYVGENSLYNPNQRFFMIDGTATQFPGRGIVINRYETRPPKITLAQLKERVNYYVMPEDWKKTSINQLTNPLVELDNYLNRYSDSLEVSSETLIKAEEVLSGVRQCLESKYGKAIALLTGSFGNRSEVATHSDVDYLLAPKRVKSSMDSTVCLQDFAEIIRRSFTEAKVFIDNPAVILSLSGSITVSVDIIPAFAVGERAIAEYHIPDGQGGWMLTVADQHKAYVRDADMYMGYSVSRLIRLIKAWKYHRAPEIRSLYLELRTAEYLHDRLARYKERVKEMIVPQPSPEEMQAFIEKMKKMFPPINGHEQFSEDWWAKNYEGFYRDEYYRNNAPSISLSRDFLLVMDMLLKTELNPMKDPLNIVAPVYGVTDMDKQGAIEKLKQACSRMEDAISAWILNKQITSLVFISELFGIDEVTPL